MLDVTVINKAMSSMVETIQDLMHDVEVLKAQDVSTLEAKITDLQNQLISTQDWFKSAGEELCDLVNSHVDKIAALEEKFENMQVSVSFEDDEE